MRHYSIAPRLSHWFQKNVKFDNVLDLTNSAVRKQLGVRLNQLTGNSYSHTQKTGELARGHYSAMLVPSARTPGISNLVIL